MPGRHEVRNFTVASLVLLFCLQPLRADDFIKKIQPVLAQHCVTCHGKKAKVKGKVNLLELKRKSDLTDNLSLLEKMVEALDSQEMPPEDEEPLDPKLRSELVAQLQKMLHEAISARNKVAQAPMRRMNRFQYSNAVRDLFDLRVMVYSIPERTMRNHGGYFKPASGLMPKALKVGSRPLGKSQLIEPRLAGVAPFPQDLRAEHGFDNRGDHLSISPLLMEAFLSLSHSIVESPSFNQKNVGIWKHFFAAPPTGSDLSELIRDRLSPFLSRAFRRPVSEESLDRFVTHALASIKAGEDFTATMKKVAAATIASPRFLYLYERSGGGDAAEAVDDFELASRLSFFLWGSIPDAPLLELARAGKLQDSDVLGKEVERMLNDGKLKRFCDSFPAQWLQLERMISSAPDPKRHPQFYFGGGEHKIGMHMMLEPLLVFETILIENRSILELIDAPFSYRSDILKSWYASGQAKGRAIPTAIPFTRVEVTDRRQGGVITNAAVLTMTSGPLRSQPITRGAWLATVIFNDPPPPPPGDVPPLPEDDHDSSKLTIREQLAAHRKRADCAGCHEKIDPLGFALENYGPTGIWRDKSENGRKVDMSGKLLRQHAFNDVTQFKDAILRDKARFTRAFAAHLLSFALAREIDTSDAVALKSIASKTKAADYHFRSMIKEVVLSDPFRQKYNPQEIAK
jgi:hypothetical protein